MISSQPRDEKHQPAARTSLVRTSGTNSVYLVIWSVWSIWLVSCNQTNQTNRTDQMNEAGWRTFSASCYRMVGSKLTLVFMELEIRQFASAFSISSLALVASVLVASVMVGFNVMVVN
ncbi:MAG: hypothetical protein EWM73_01405 [Nitrospira sp.]|nr:MAG: hypothetical protein EWM73_01405 [Nitrospira sp.]